MYVCICLYKAGRSCVSIYIYIHRCFRELRRGRRSNCFSELKGGSNSCFVQVIERSASVTGKAVRAGASSMLLSCVSVSRESVRACVSSCY